MKDGETIQEMHTRFTSCLNEMHSLGEAIPRGKAIHKLLSVLPSSWEAINEAGDLDILILNDLIGNLITYELKKNQEREVTRERKDRNLVLKVTEKSNFKEENMSFITRRFRKMFRKVTTFRKGIKFQGFQRKYLVSNK